MKRFLLFLIAGFGVLLLVVFVMATYRGQMKEAPAPPPPPRVENYELKVNQPDGTVASETTEIVSLPKAAIDKSGDTISKDNPNLYTVWFGTNRALTNSADSSGGFSSERSQTVRYGTCDVVIPSNHEFGSLGSTWIYRKITGSDDPVQLQRINVQDEPLFWSGLKEALSRLPPGRRDALVFIHGFNVSFEQAAIRCAQVGFDLKITGATAFFSWPASVNYVADGSSIDASEGPITDFLTRFARDVGAENVHILAHSMGNRGLLRAVDRIAAHASAQSKVRFGQIFLAAPDVDVEVFKMLASAYPKVSKRTTLYMSAKDKALQLSTGISNFQRVGLYPPPTIVNGIDTVYVPFVNLLSVFELDHSYFGEAAGVLHDMFDLVRSNRSPADRQRIAQESADGGGVYWQLQP